jgi:uncharacterized membrane protein
MENHIIIAGGPVPTPETLPVMVVLFACPLVAVTLLVASIVIFRRKRAAGAFCFFISLLFLTPLWELGSNGPDMLIHFAIVSVIAVIASWCYLVFYARHKM